VIANEIGAVHVDGEAVIHATFQRLWYREHRWRKVYSLVSGLFLEVCAVRYRVLIDQDEDGVYVVEAPALPGCISQGKMRSEAIDNIKEAIAGYLESLQAHAEPIPPSIGEEVVEVTP
jgi:antitoxin HicB